MSNDLCTICHEKITGVKNIAVFDCGHKYHLSCSLNRASYFDTKCMLCSEVHNKSLKVDLGDDRETAMLAEIEAKIKRNRMQPKAPKSILFSMLSVLTPFRSSPNTFKDYLNCGYSLNELKKMGYTPRDGVEEKIPWKTMRKNVDIKQLLQFGFKWEDMVNMGIVSEHLKDFTWSQVRHTLGLNAKDILKLNITLDELADLNYTPQQLNDLGFTWDILSAMGANVKTMKSFNMSIEDVKTYFNPSLNQWLEAGFYNKDQLQKNDWNVESVSQVLPRMTGRVDGRTLRLAF